MFIKIVLYKLSYIPSQTWKKEAIYLAVLSFFIVYSLTSRLPFLETTLIFLAETFFYQ